MACVSSVGGTTTDIASPVIFSEARAADARVTAPLTLSDSSLINREIIERFSKD